MLNSQIETDEKARELNIQLRERIKELSGLYALGKLTDETRDLNEVFSRFLKEIVPLSMQFPEKTIARIEFDNKLYCNAETFSQLKKESLQANIFVKSRKRGALSVNYTGDLPFIPEFEQKLIEGYAERLGKITERIEAEKEVNKLNPALKERIKELTGLYSLGKLTEETRNLDEFFSRFVEDIIPPSMQFPEKTIAKIEFDDNLYSNSKDSFASKSSLNSNIFVKGKKRGKIIVAYNQELPFIPKFEQKLIDGYAERLGKITERIEAEKEIKVTRDQLTKVIDNASELIFSVDKNNIIISWNQSLSSITGYSKKELLFKNIFSEEIPTEIAPLIELMKSTLKTKRSELMEHEIKDRYGNIKTILSHTSIISGKDNDIEGAILIGRDISHEKSLHQSLVPGNSYLSYNESFDKLIDTFNVFGKKNYPLLYISRENFSLLKNKLFKKASILLMSRNTINGAETEIEPAKIVEHIKNFINTNKQGVILMTRLEYISSKYSFKDLLNFLYTLNDTIADKKVIVMIHITEDCFEKNELALLKQEFMEFPNPKEYDINLDNKKIDVLKYILNKNSVYFTVSYNLISREFNISRVTTKKWLNELQISSLIRIEKKGNIKQVNITDKGKELISGY